MRKNKQKESSKNLHLGFYFGFLVFLIILVSISFKVFDTIKRSEFDGDNFFTVAIISKNNAQIISVSPKESLLKKLTIKGKVDQKSLNSIGIPYDSIAESKSDISTSPKAYFTKLLFHRDGFKSNLTIIDLIRLSIYSQKTDSAKIQDESVSVEDKLLTETVSDWFHDPEIIKENESIEITNTTSTSGLGNRFAKDITNMGGNVVLVNSSPELVKKSKIYYKDESYTVNKLSKLLEIPIEKKVVNSISDIVIEIGEDKANF